MPQERKEEEKKRKERKSERERELILSPSLRPLKRGTLH